MPTLFYRNLSLIEEAPRRDFAYKIVKVGKSLCAVYEDGAVWDFDARRWRVPDIDKDGYRITSIGGKIAKIHRLILMVFKRAPKYGEQCRHIDGDPSNNHIDNLEWGSGKENWIDRRNHGREGAKWRRLLTKEQALAIYNDPRPERDIAKQYNIQRLCVVLIKEKRTYKEIHYE